MMLSRMAAGGHIPRPFPNVTLEERVDPRLLVGWSCAGPSMKPWALHPLVWPCWLELLLSVSSAAVGDVGVHGMRKRKRKKRQALCLWPSSGPSLLSYGCLHLWLSPQLDWDTFKELIGLERTGLELWSWVRRPPLETSSEIQKAGEEEGEDSPWRPELPGERKCLLSRSQERKKSAPSPTGS